MDREEPAEGSSSPRDSFRISFRKRKGGTEAAWEVGLADGSSFFALECYLDRDIASILSSVAQEPALDGAQRENLERAHGASAAESAALKLLARAEQSRKGLFTKLLKRGHQEPAIAIALDRLESLGYLSDSRFAKAWLSSREKAHPESSASLEAGLMRRGISRETIRELLGENRRARDAQAIRVAAQSLTRRRELDKESLTRKLYARGFSQGDILRYLRGDDSEE